MITHKIEQFREWLAFRIYPDLSVYFSAVSIMGELNENDRVIELIKQSKFKNKKAIIELVEHHYKPVDITDLLDDASEDQTS